VQVANEYLSYNFGSILVTTATVIVWVLYSFIYCCKGINTILRSSVN